MYIKFKKEHPVGINKGEMKVVDNETALEFIEGNYAEESTEEEYGSWLKAFNSNEVAESDKRMEEAKRLNEGRSLSNQENGEPTKGKKKQYHKLTKADVEVNKEHLGDLKVGDQVLLDKDGNLAVDAKNNLIKKGN